MPVRFDADAENYSRTLTLGAQADFSVSIWVNIRTDRNTYSTPWSLAATTSNYSYIQTDTDGTSMAYWDHVIGSPTGSRALTIGTWYWWGISHNGANVTVKSRSATDTSFTTSTSSASGNITLTTLLIGESVFNTEWLNGSVAGFKFWLAALSAAELEAEFFTMVPQRSNSLRLWQPFVRPETADWSGNGNTLSGGSGTAVDNDGPPIPWGWGQATILLPPASTTVTGTLAGDLPAVTGSFSGGVEVSGTMAGTLPAVTGSLTGSVEVSGTMAGTLPTVTGAFTGSVEVSGTMAGTLPSVTGALTGSVEVSGALAGTLPGVTGSFAGSIEVSGSLSGILPAITGSALGEVRATGTLAGTLPLVTGSFTGTVVEPTVSGEFAIILPAVTGSFEGISGAVGISAVLNGPSVRIITLTGVTVERLITGASVERLYSGVAVVTIEITGPAVSVVTSDGPATERDITGPSTQRVITGVGV